MCPVVAGLRLAGNVVTLCKLLKKQGFAPKLLVTDNAEAANQWRDAVAAA